MAAVISGSCVAAHKRLMGQIRIEGEKGLTLAAADRILAAQATELLRPYGKNVLDAARAYAETLRAAANDTTIAVLFKEYVQSKHRAKHQAVSIGDITSRLGRFNAEFGHRPAKSIQPDEIEAWLHGLDVKPVTVNHYRALLHAFFALPAQAPLNRCQPGQRNRQTQVS
jgi:hypothetical protein